MLDWHHDGHCLLCPKYAHLEVFRSRCRKGKNEYFLFLSGHSRFSWRLRTHVPPICVVARLRFCLLNTSMLSYSPWHLLLQHFHSTTGRWAGRRCSSDWDRLLQLIAVEEKLHCNREHRRYQFSSMLKPKARQSSGSRRFLSDGYRPLPWP